MDGTKRQRRVIPIAPALKQIPSRETPFLYLLREEETAILERIATKVLLDPREREVFARRNKLFGEGVCSFAVIGRDLGISPTTVAKIEKRALQKISDHYKPELSAIKTERLLECAKSNRQAG